MGERGRKKRRDKGSERERVGGEGIEKSGDEKE